MSRGSSWGVSLGLATALLTGVNGCDDNNNTNHSDLSVGDLSMAKGDGGQDAAASMPSTGQITVADLVGTAFTSDGSPETNIHVLKVVASFPLHENTSPNQDPNPLNGCTWDRYDVTDPAKLPPPNENAGTVDITGFDTVYDVPFLGGSTPAPPMPSTVHCEMDTSNALAQYGCTLGTGAGALPLDDYAFPTIPFAALSPLPPPPASPSPSPDPMGFYNTDLFLRSNTAIEVFTPSAGSSFSTALNKTLPLTGVSATTRILPPTVIATTIDGAAGPTTLAGLSGQLDGTHDITITYSCDGSAMPGSGCATLGITGLLIQTSLGKKWEAFSGPNELRFGVMQCVDATMSATMPFKFTLPKARLATVVGSDTGQTISIALVRLKAAIAGSGPHTFYATAGRGQFALVDQ